MNHFKSHAIGSLFTAALAAATMAMAQTPSPAPAAQITFESLLDEMVDRTAVARWPDPAYTCRQFSSYDRASISADKPETWFANGDAGHFLRVEEVAARGSTPAHKEWVMADMAGPGAVVRMWTPNPKGMLRIYIDGSVAPALEAPVADLLSGKIKNVPSPIAQSRASGWNCYLPIPYAKSCKVTSDEGGFYYQVNYRTYEAGAQVRSFEPQALNAAAVAIETVRAALAAATDETALLPVGELGAESTILGAGQSRTDRLETPGGESGRAVTRCVVTLGGATGSDPEEFRRALSGVIISASFDGERTIWCRLGDFFATGTGLNAVADWYRTVQPPVGMAEINGPLKLGDTVRAAKAPDWAHGRVPNVLMCNWVMPFQRTAEFMLTNLGSTPLGVGLRLQTEPLAWDSRSMHFHAGWRQQHPIRTKAGAGAMDWNYVEISGGRGVYVGDNLAIANPVAAWWGEGDEKIYVDGESFPSHFGTGTEDYYGYGWCSPDVFLAPFQSQVRCDGGSLSPRNNWGHTFLTRVRSLDAIPFTSSLKFDMEVWHWAECDIGYAATTYWYAAPGVTSNRGESVNEVKRGVIEVRPLPPPFTIAGALECESMKILSRSPDGAGPDGRTLNAVAQDMSGFARPEREWSGGSHLWVQARGIGDAVELEVPANSASRKRLKLHATKSWDYGIVRTSVNGTIVPQNLELCSRKQGLCEPTGGIDLGVHSPRSDDGKHRFVLKFELTQRDPAALAPGTFFGLDCVTVEDAE